MKQPKATGTGGRSHAEELIQIIERESRALQEQSSQGCSRLTGLSRAANRRDELEDAVEGPAVTQAPSQATTSRDSYRHAGC